LILVNKEDEQWNILTAYLLRKKDLALQWKFLLLDRQNKIYTLFYNQIGNSIEGESKSLQMKVWKV
jgi:hypothetical protein